MIINNDKVYIIKQSDNTTFKFSYKENIGIVYQPLVGNLWSESIVIFKTVLNNFCILLLPNDKIYLFCQSSQGHIVLCKYEDMQWESNIILKSKNDSIQEIYLDTILCKNEINIVYCIPDEKSKHMALFHQIVNSDAKLSPAKMIDIITNPFVVPFLLHSDGSNLYLAYQNLKEDYLLGYKVLLEGSSSWSNFIILDHSLLPYYDYSIVSSNLNIHYSYVKNTDTRIELNYYNTESKEVTSLYRGEEILCCSMFILDNILWILWICQNKIFGYFSKNNGKTFEAQLYYKEISPLNVQKAIYQSNLIEDIDHIILKEVFITSGNSLDILVLGSLYNIKAEKDVFIKELSIIDSFKEVNQYKVNAKTYLDRASERLNYYEKKISQKDALISQLNEMLKTEKNGSQILSKKYSLLENSARKFKEDLNELHSNLNLKENELEHLKNNSSQLEGELLAYKNRLKVIEQSNKEQFSTISLLQTRIIKLKDIEKLNKDQLNTTALLKTKIVDYERQIIQNHKTLEKYKSEITLLQIKNMEKDSVLHSFERQIDELSTDKKNYENQISLQSEKIISYLKKIQNLQDNIKSLKSNFEAASTSNNSSMLKRIFRNSN